MAYDGDGRYLEGFSAAADLSSSLYYVVRSTGGMTVALCTSATGGISRAKGVLVNEPASGQEATVRTYGFSKAVAGGAITAGDLIVSSTAGTVITTTGTTGQWVLGWADTASTASGQTISIFIDPYIFMGSTA